MKIGTPREVYIGEARVGMTPESARQLQKLGYECVIEAGAGAAAGFSDKTYKDAGVTVAKSAAALCNLHSEPPQIKDVKPMPDFEILEKCHTGKVRKFRKCLANE